MGRLDGKVGVVTGSSKGLGREIVYALTQEGASVVGLARNAELGQAVADQATRKGGGAAVFEQGDVTCEEDIVRAIERCGSEFGGFDLIVNNAGILGEGRLHETTNEQWRDLVAVHMTGASGGASTRSTSCGRAGRAARSSTSARSFPSQATATWPPTRR